MTTYTSLPFARTYVVKLAPVATGAVMEESLPLKVTVVRDAQLVKMVAVTLVIPVGSVT